MQTHQAKIWKSGKCLTSKKGIILGNPLNTKCPNITQAWLHLVKCPQEQCLAERITTSIPSKRLRKPSLGQPIIKWLLWLPDPNQEKWTRLSVKHAAQSANLSAKIRILGLEATLKDQSQQLLQSQGCLGEIKSPFLRATIWIRCNIYQGLCQE